MYLDVADILFILLFAFVGYYLLLAMRSKDLAIRAAEHHCEQMQVQFLDQTAFLKIMKLKRNLRGNLSIMREFNFEFTVNGEDRYTGRVFMLGSRIESVNLDTHRLH